MLVEIVCCVGFLVLFAFWFVPNWKELMKKSFQNQTYSELHQELVVYIGHNLSDRYRSSFIDSIIE